MVAISILKKLMYGFSTLAALWGGHRSHRTYMLRMTFSTLISLIRSDSFFSDTCKGDGMKMALGVEVREEKMEGGEVENIDHGWREIDGERAGNQGTAIMEQIDHLVE